MRIASFLIFLLISISATAQNYYLFIGTYTNTGSKGIYVCRFNGATGKLDTVSNTEGSISNPSFLTIAPNGKFIYACSEAKESEGASINAFMFNKETGKLKFINKQPSGGDDPAYVAVNKNNKWLVSANYTGGNVIAYPIKTDGSIQPYAQQIQHSGSGINKQRQEKPHVHATVFSPANDYVLATDLGADKIISYPFNEKLQKPLQVTTPAIVITTAGSGPRHLAFHPNGKYVYCMEELSGIVSAYSYDNGKLNSIQYIPAHTTIVKGPFGSSDIHLSPDGLFLYAANRAEENNIAIFAVDEKSGILKLVGYQSTLGKMPRNFTIDPSGKFLLVANQQTGNIVVFKRDLKTGLLTPTGVQITIPKPTCLQLMKI